MSGDNRQERPSVTEIIDSLKEKPGALLPILHGIQEAYGYVPPEVEPMIAERLNLSRAEVHGVVSFYHHFHTAPPGRHVIRLCRAEACQSMGARELERHAKARLGIDYHQQTADGAISLEPVYCLGNCACSPSVRVDDEVLGRMDAEKFDRLVEELQTRAAEVN